MLKVFLSYATEDRDLVDPYYLRLEDEGFDPWMDHRKLLPGQNWTLEIDRAFDAANVVLLFMSPRSVRKRGFVQREANEAVDRLRQKLPDDIYLIPLLLEPCEVPNHISVKQYLDLGRPGAWGKVLKSLIIAAEQQQIELREGTRAGPFRVYTERTIELHEQDPRHEISLDIPRFESSTYTQQAEELTKLFGGQSLEQLASFRSDSWENARGREPIENWGSDFGSSFGVAFANKNVLSLWFTDHSYFMGTAHGNSFYRTYNFALQPHLMKLSLMSFFDNKSKGLKRFSEICIAEIVKAYGERAGEVDDSAMKHIKSGAGPDLQNFEAFTFDGSKFTVLFPPYQIAAYAAGLWSIDVKYSELSEFLVKDGPHTLAADS